MYTHIPEWLGRQADEVKRTMFDFVMSLSATEIRDLICDSYGREFGIDLIAYIPSRIATDSEASESDPITEATLRDYSRKPPERQ
jgi:hypothetical protein